MRSQVFEFVFFRQFFTHWSCLDPAFEWRFPLCRSKSKHWAGLQLMIWIFPKDFRSLNTRLRNAKRTTNSRDRLLALRTKTFQLYTFSDASKGDIRMQP